MESDLYEVMLASTEGRLAETPVSFKPGAAAATVVLAADGYPGKYPKGMPISGLEDAAAIPGVTVYHAGTKAAAPAPSTGTDISVSGGEGGGAGVVSSGGRVLAVTGMGSTFTEALDAAYRGVGVVKFSPCHYRKDIGHRAKTAPLRVGVLASGRGTALQAVIDSCEAGVSTGGVNAEVVLVVTNKKEAPVRERAKKHGIPEIFVASRVSCCSQACLSRVFGLLVGGLFSPWARTTAVPRDLRLAQEGSVCVFPLLDLPTPDETEAETTTSSSKGHENVLFPPANTHHPGVLHLLRHGGTNPCFGCACGRGAC